MKPLEISGEETWDERPSSGPLASAKRWLTRWRAPRGGDAASDDRELSFDDIYEDLHGLVWKMLLREGIPPAQAEEILQDVFLTLHGEMKTSKIRNAAALLVTITKHEISNYRDKRSSTSEVAVDDQDDVPASRPDAEGQLSLAERARIVRAILASMPPDLAELIERIDLDRQTQREVAEAKNLPLGTVKSRHRAAKEMFRNLAALKFGLVVGGDL